MNCSMIKKVELHCHADGILNQDIIKEASKQEHDISVPIQELQARSPVNSFNDFIKWFEPVNALFKGRGERLLPVLAQHIINLKAQNVIYTEIMIPGMMYTYLDENKAIDLFRAFRELADSFEDGAIQVEFLVAFGRNRPVENIKKRVKTILKLFDVGLVCGIAVCGMEVGNPVKPFRSVLEHLSKSGLGIEVHAGEWVGPESIWDALENGFPRRIGHGVAAFDEPELLETIRKQDIHIEICPTSNVKTGSVTSIEKHPVRQALDMGLNFSINTDDPGPFECTLTSEFELLTEKFGFTCENFKKVYENSLKSRFQKQLRYIDENLFANTD